MQKNARNEGNMAKCMFTVLDSSFISDLFPSILRKLRRGPSICAVRYVRRLSKYLMNFEAIASRANRFLPHSCIECINGIELDFSLRTKSIQWRAHRFLDIENYKLEP